MPSQLLLFAPQDRSADWRVRVSPRARRLSVRIYPGGKVEIVVPPRVAPRAIQRFIGQNRQWIEQRVQEWRAEAVVSTRPDRLELPALGRSVSITYRVAPGATRVVSRTGTSDALEVRGAIDDLHHVATALDRWLRRQVAAAMESQVKLLAAAGPFPYRRIRIRRQRTRWGSCSTGGTLSLNVCLAFLEPAVVRYLLVHELCHTRHMNHSRRFWTLVEQHEPDFEALDRELSRGWRRVPSWILL